MKRAALLPALLLTLLGVPGAAAGAAAPTPIAQDSIGFSDLKPCERPNLPDRLRCGFMTLPFERADPSLGSIRIAFAVLPRKERGSRGRAPVIAIEGGPGYGSIGSVNYYARTFGNVLKHRDLLLIDARGTGKSQPIKCRDLQQGLADSSIGLATCAEQLGRRFDSYRTSAIVDDINDIRAALGYEKVRVYGDSYGTFAAQSYAFRHGDTLERLVLDSAYPVKGESPWYPSTWKTGIRSLTIVCGRTANCRPGAAGRLRRFVSLLRKHQVGTGRFLDLLSEAGYSPPGSYRKINQMISAYLGGNGRAYRRLTAPGPVGYGKAGAYSYGMELAVSCNDYPMIWNKASNQSERVAELNDAIRAHPGRAFSPFTPREIALTAGFSYLECTGAPPPGPYYEPPAGPDMPAPDVPVLVISGELDNVTSPAEGSAAAALFPDSKLFVWKNAGHVYSLNDRNSAGAVKIRRFFSR